MTSFILKYTRYVSEPFPLPSGVVNCSNFLVNYPRPRPTSKDHCVSCKGIKCGCVSYGWLSKTTPGRVNATQICIDQGYSGEILEYGNNGGKQCKIPIDLVVNSKENELESIVEGPVSWQCASGTILVLKYIMRVFFHILKKQIFGLRQVM